MGLLKNNFPLLWVERGRLEGPVSPPSLPPSPSYSLTTPTDEDATQNSKLRTQNLIARHARIDQQRPIVDAAEHIRDIVEAELMGQVARDLLAAAAHMAEKDDLFVARQAADPLVRLTKR